MSRSKPIAPPLPGPVLRSRVLAYVAEKRWRGEIGIIRHFTRKVHVPGGWCRERAPRSVEDALFELVKAGKLEWFGAEDPNGHLPLRYRVPKAVKPRRRS